MKGDGIARHDTETALYQQQLEQYVHTYLQQNYSVENIFSHLMSQGHEEAQVKKALHTVNSRYYNNSLEIASSSSPVKKLLVAGFLVVVLCLGAFLFFSTPTYEFFITLETTRLGVNDPLSFGVVATDTVDLNVLIQTGTGNFVLEQNEQVKASGQVFIWLPEDLPTGFYTAEVLEVYQGEEVRHSFSFQIVSAGVPSSQQDVDLLRSGIIQSDILFCQQITSRTLKDDCYAQIAINIGDESLCEFISAPLEQDRCYFSQVLNGNPIRCQVIEDIPTRDACENV